MNLIRITRFSEWYEFSGPTLFILPLKEGETAYSNLNLADYGFMNLMGSPLTHEGRCRSIIHRLFLFTGKGSSHLVCQEWGGNKEHARYVTIKELTISP